MTFTSGKWRSCVPESHFPFELFSYICWHVSPWTSRDIFAMSGSDFGRMKRYTDKTPVYAATSTAVRPSRRLKVSGSVKVSFLPSWTMS